MTAIKRFEQKAIVITGAASGIGRAAALRLAQEGADIVALDLSEQGLASLHDDITATGQRCETIVGSVENLDNVQAAVSRATEVYGGLDALINNAGVSGSIRRFDKIEPGEFDKMSAINLKPVWYGIKIAFEPMRNRGGGAIVNVASIAGVRPNRFAALYGMTKAAIISLTHHAAMDYASSNIRVNCLCPGPVETPIFEQMEQRLGPQGYQDARGTLLRRTLLNRMGTAQEQAAAIAYLLSDEASFITGIAMPVDGGWSVSDGQTV